MADLIRSRPAPDNSDILDRLAGLEDLLRDLSDKVRQGPSLPPSIRDVSSQPTPRPPCTTLPTA